ncbi:hypothetical protein GW17_00042435 [Ensete ventricosum]|nr:hypothetical protein GW17_00042435 [Ensete ventricosum]
MLVARSSTNKILPPGRTKRYESSKNIEADEWTRRRARFSHGESDRLTKLCSSSSRGCESITDMPFAAESFSGTFQSFQSWEMDSHITQNHIDALDKERGRRKRCDRGKRCRREINAAVVGGRPSRKKKKKKKKKKGWKWLRIRTRGVTGLRFPTLQQTHDQKRVLRPSKKQHRGAATTPHQSSPPDPTRQKYEQKKKEERRRKSTLEK